MLATPRAKENEMSQTARNARWWELPEADQRKGRQGKLAFVQGTTTGITCPKCKDQPIVYNGNYFCDGYAPLDFSSAGTCDWALAHPARSKRDRAVCDLIGLDYQ
jgi:hypothetical protein